MGPLRDAARWKICMANQTASRAQRLKRGLRLAIAIICPRYSAITRVLPIVIATNVILAAAFRARGYGDYGSMLRRYAFYSLMIYVGYYCFLFILAAVVFITTVTRPSHDNAARLPGPVG
jgi:hypothetical protein